MTLNQGQLCCAITVTILWPWPKVICVVQYTHTHTHMDPSFGFGNFTAFFTKSFSFPGNFQPLFSLISCLFWHDSSVQFTNDFSFLMDVWQKTRIVKSIIFWLSLLIFAHTMTAQLLCHVQKCVQVTLYDRILDESKTKFTWNFNGFGKILSEMTPFPI